jgi:hypothetical protein
MSVGFFTLTSGQWDQDERVADRGSDKGDITYKQKKGLTIEKKGEGTKSNSVIKIDRQISPDQMQHLVEQLFMLLTQDKSKTKINGILINLFNFSNNNQ